jgi:lipopolysaccharide export system permease protein
MVFFFLMQMVWKYIDDLAGRGIEWYYIVELLFFWSATVMPYALPISVLLSSLMTFGAFGEHYELAAMKSAGISLQRIMRPVTFMVILISIGAFFFANNVIPVANLKAFSLIENISKKKPAFNVRSGIFYSGIDGYSIKIGRKSGDDGGDLEDILIYDHTDHNGNTKVTSAKTGKMVITPDERYLEITLRDGFTYEDVKAKSRKEREKKPFIKASFSEALIRFNLSQFQSGDLREAGSKNFMMMNVAQLEYTVDSLRKGSVERRKEFASNIKAKYYFENVSLDSAQPENVTGDILAYLNGPMSVRAIQNAQRIARSNTEFLNQAIAENDWRDKMQARHAVEVHKKFTLSAACFVLFFIGAPLGAIIRKGGMGAPVVFSFIIFIGYHVLNTIFEKYGQDVVLEPWISIWAGTFILMPFGLLLTLSAANDSSILSSEFYTNFKRIFTNPFNRKKKTEDEDSAALQ